ncbi:Fpg/Nei family DNA glycosylase [Humibacter sp. BT305]|uniref:Fpg/Nei family DNA glycosylase n=1 Tax=Cnuibacter physcomitrellae TaxID=1619308 RepID=UPI000E108F92|nr:DNA glycosylase [Cnuibacter physcomitrellae]AXH36447.1 Fpg/Nei family DNA glycosylase [Humibacter sp. BT305]MCS5499114.1 Fpg/Nei family DNA glycosylase [Cnuibacter physcomitrellae]
MPEGHSVHRIARQFAKNFVGHRVTASSPQGRFAAGAALLDGHTMVEAKAVGKQMFLRFDDDRWLRVHLGMYGAWDFAGDISTDATIRSASGRMGQTNQRGTDPTDDEGTDLDDVAGEDSVSSIGAPRRSRFRMAESESAGAEYETWPPEPVGQVRVRLLTDTAVADLRGPTACEVLDPPQVEAVLAKLGPDPLVDDLDEGERRFVETASRKPTPIGLLLMDQSVVSGIGNVYRAELLFRARLDPHTPGRAVPTDVLRELWRDWVHLLDIGVRTGQMLTIDDLTGEALAQAMANRADRHWVYKREGLPCRICGTNIVLEEMGARKLYWCPTDQV